MIRALNLLLLIVFPAAWFAPLLQAGVALPLFPKSEITIISGLQSLWEVDPALALIVTVLAIFVPMAKTGGLALVQFGLLDRAALPVLAWVGKFAMADVFLIALYVLVVKGAGLAEVETQWGIHLFTACVLASLVLSLLEARR